MITVQILCFTNFSPFLLLFVLFRLKSGALVLWREFGRLELGANADILASIENGEKATILWRMPSSAIR